MIGIFKISYWTVAILWLLISLAAIIACGVQRSQIISACVAENADLTYDNCAGGYRTLMIIMSVVLVVVSLIQVKFISQSLMIYSELTFLLIIALFCYSY